MSVLKEYIENYGKKLSKVERDLTVRWISKVSGLILGVGLGIKFTPMMENQEQIHRDAETMALNILDSVNFHDKKSFGENNEWYQYGRRPNSQFIVSIFSALMGKESLDYCITKLEKTLIGEQYKEILQAFITCSLILHNFKPVEFAEIKWDGIFNEHIPLLMQQYCKHSSQELKNEQKDITSYLTASYEELSQIANDNIMRNVILVLKGFQAGISMDVISRVVLMNSRDRNISLYNNMVVFALYGSMCGHEAILKLATSAKLNIAEYEDHAVTFFKRI